MDETNSTSTRPYLIRALHDWCSDNGFTPYIVARVDASVRVPTEYVKDGEIVLNISFDAVNALQLGNEYIEFKARFGGVLRPISVPVERVQAIYARENGQGMAFPVTELDAHAPMQKRNSGPLLAAVSEAAATQIAASPSSEKNASDDETQPPTKPTKRPILKIVK